MFTTYVTNSKFFHTFVTNSKCLIQHLRNKFNEFPLRACSISRQRKSIYRYYGLSMAVYGFLSSFWKEIWERTRVDITRKDWRKVWKFRCAYICQYKVLWRNRLSRMAYLPEIFFRCASSQSSTTTARSPLSSSSSFWIEI